MTLLNLPFWCSLLFKLGSSRGANCHPRSALTHAEYGARETKQGLKLKPKKCTVWHLHQSDSCDVAIN